MHVISIKNTSLICLTWKLAAFAKSGLLRRLAKSRRLIALANANKGAGNPG